MKITHAQVQHRQVPIADPVRTAFGVMRARHAVFLVLQDDCGHRGLGESWVNFPSWGPWERVAAYERAILPWLEGREVADAPTASRELYHALIGPAQQSGTVAPMVAALCGVEMALWDLIAQREGLPLSELLFDEPRARVGVYASGINSPIPWDLIDEHLDRGVTLFKLKLGFGDQQDRRSLGALRQHLGDRADLAVDVNRGWSLQQALRWLPLLNDHRVRWVEEPLRLADEPQLGILRSHGAPPIAWGENAILTPDCDLEAIARSPADVLEPDLTKYAPLHLARALLDVAQAHGKRVVPHFLGSAPGQAASLHFAAGCDEGLVEMDINRNPLRSQLFAEPFRVEGGMVAIPQRPGLGWTLKA